MVRELVYGIKAPIRWLRRLYDWTLHWSKKPEAPVALFLVAFIESSFFPIPPDVLLIAMVAADRSRWWIYALICTAGSVCGALLGYAIGWGFYETVGKLIVKTYHLEQQVDVVGKMYANNAFWAVFTAAFTPIPYKIFTIAAGLFRVSIAVLVAASIVGRAGRFFLVAILLKLFGEKITSFIERYFDAVAVVFTALLIGGYLLIKGMAH